MRKNQNEWISVLFLVFIIFVTAGCGTSQDTKEDTSDTIDCVSETPPEVSPETSPTKEKTRQGLILPYELDDGRLMIRSVFPSTIANPDCNEEDGEDIASIEVVNQSGEFLVSADITVILDDDSAWNFRLTDIPAGTSVWAFETGNAEIAEDTICKSVECETEYETDMPVMEEVLAVEADGTMVTIQNLTGETLTGLKAGFHCLFDEDLYYGGCTYTYPIDTIPAGESISLEVEECYLGMAQAVRITQD